MAEILLSATLPVLFEKLASSDFYNFAFDEGVRSKLKKWERKLEKIEAVLTSAEEKQLTNRAVKLWLEDLQHLAYDVEDILEEFAYEASRHSSAPSCLKNFTPRAIKFDVSMRSRIEDISSRFEELCKERAELGLMHETSGGTSSAYSQQKVASSSVPTEPAVFGREEDKRRILEMVLSDEPSNANLFVIGILAMGGIGKTTLAREVYNDKALDSKFMIKSWVSVSDDFDVLRISNTVLSSINESDEGPAQPKNKGLADESDKAKGQSENKEVHQSKKKEVEGGLDNVLVQLKNAIKGKRVLVVLDDVWNENYNLWESLKSPFRDAALGSKIIVTTRNKEVVQSSMKSPEIYELKQLPHANCLELFKSIAFGEGDPKAYGDICDKIVDKCKGLPLAVKTLAGVLRSKQIDLWENILTSRMWDSHDAGGILPVLRLSYFYLPPHLKRCFAYCAIFPKDYEFDEKELGLLWMAEGIIQQSNEQLDVAGQCFHDLCSRSLFEHSSNNSSKYIMHDLVHDLAQSIFGEISFRFEEGNTKLSKKFEKIRHFSYICDDFKEEKKFKSLEKLRSLRTFLPIFTMPFGEHYITAMLLFGLLSKIKKLRVLSFERYYITHLPDSIGDLIHLRYLNFSYTMIKSLPESTSQLFNLQTLLLKDCSCLVKLPSKMRYLTNLYHLDISGQNSLKEMPSGMKELKNLRVLSNFIVGKESGSNLEDLKSLNCLRGKLHISKLENVTIVTKRGGLILSNKLIELLLEWGSKSDGSGLEGVEKEVLEMLKPHSNLEKLTIKSYGGLKFSSWLSTSSSLSKLTVLKLKNCENCRNLPSQSLLSSLKELVIERMPKLERINMGIHYNSLEILCLENLQTCQYWDTKVENKNIESFPKLRELSIIKCPRLTIELIDHAPLLEKIVIKKCAKWMVSFSSFPKLTELEIVECKEVVCTGSSTEFMSPESKSLSNVVEFENWLSQNFDCVEKPRKWSHSLTSLKSLCIEEDCSISFLNTIFLPNLSVLSFSTCKALKSLPKRLKQNNIECLRISNCDSLLFIARNTLPSSLKRLDISFCEKLQHLEGISSTLLEDLTIRNCKSLTCLSSRGLLPKTLKILVIHSCRSLTCLSSRSWCIHETLDKLHISDCPKLKSVAMAFQNSSCLETFSITDLSIWGAGDVETIQTLIRLGLHNLTSLKRLQIGGFEDSELLLPEDQQMPTSLEFLDISNFAPFRNISDLGTLTSLTDLCIRGSTNLVSISDLGSLVSLKSFSIINCSNIKSILDLGSHTSLEEFTIWHCPNLKSIARLGSLTSLQKLDVWDCPKLKSIARLGSLTSLQKLEIWDCPKLISLSSLPPSLLELEIDECPWLKIQWRRDTRQGDNHSGACIDDLHIYHSKEEHYEQKKRRGKRLRGKTLNYFGSQIEEPIRELSHSNPAWCKKEKGRPIQNNLCPFKRIDGKKSLEELDKVISPITPTWTEI